ncbi:hypothetical protein ACNAW0_21995 [Micromonospora sp. SL1-18]|uniref:hypothetical protein n=1 Tax=Micromonospora sp. SL1-18 TaxID=3399128 RepID=UPI003A4E3139
MRNMLKFLRPAGRAAESRPPNGGWYRSASCAPLTAGQIRERQFRNVRRGVRR